MASSSTRKTSELAQHRIETYAFLFGKDWALSPRATFTALVGVSAARHVDHEEYTIETTRLGIVSTMSETDDSSDVISTLAFGADVAVAVTRRLSIVPGFRAHAPLGYDSWFNIWRPGISVRWKF